VTRIDGRRMATNTHIRRGRTIGRNLVRLLIGATAIATGGYAYGASQPHSTVTSRPAVELAATIRNRPFSYGWPVKPFDQQHPVRGNFADPRSIFSGAPTVRGLMTSACACSYHQGIDISAPDGSAVYPVRSGVVRIVTHEWVEVDSANGSAFQYWHIAPLVHVGDRVARDDTVLGHILRHSQHVHLTQLEEHRPVNPLAPGNIGPYQDTTVPRVNEISFRAGDTGPQLLPEYVHGRIEIVVDAEDSPALPVPGLWHGLPVSAAKLTYTITNLPHRKVVDAGTALDVTHSLPAADMWRTYARGTHMNMVKIGAHRYWFQPGRYLVKLTRSAVDTRRFDDGAYALTVTAWDTEGNHSSMTQVFSVHNRASWLNG